MARKTKDKTEGRKLDFDRFMYKPGELHLYDPKDDKPPTETDEDEENPFNMTDEELEDKARG
jgi:hypothetical protein